MKRWLPWLMAVVCVLTLVGCGGAPDAQPSPAGPDSTASPGQSPYESLTPEGDVSQSIPFLDGQLYAAAYLGYQEINDLDFYTEHYLDGGALPVHYVSPGDYYLIIPRCPGMTLRLYQNDIQTGDSALIYEDPDCRPFLLQCNASDIFADVTVSFTYQEEQAEFSPYISLEDGSVQVGDRGLNLTN